jgi:hypothetical protein
VTADLTAALALLPDAARAELDVSVIGSTDLKDYVHLQRKLTRHIEEARADRVLSTAKAAVAAAAPGSELHTQALRNLAHLRASDGTWLLAPALAHMRMSASHYRIRLRRFLRLTLPVCNYADGAGSTRPPRSASNVANPTHDLYGDFTLSDEASTAVARAATTSARQAARAARNWALRAAKTASSSSVSCVGPGHGVMPITPVHSPATCARARVTTAAFSQAQKSHLVTGSHRESPGVILSPSLPAVPGGWNTFGVLPRSALRWMRCVPHSGPGGSWFGGIGRETLC